MIKGLSEYDKFKVVRPIIGECEYNQYSMPVIKRTDINQIDFENLAAQGYQNLSKKRDNSNTLVLMFLDDKKLLSLWNSPLKKIPLFKTCAAVATPDFSVYSSMNINDIQHNVYMNRWLGRTWQNYGITVLPTIGWAGSYTYDICLGAVEVGTPVVISTIGCSNNEKEFLDGFNEMKKRINPPLIIVYGDMIKGMTGKFINFKYTECFLQPYQQLKFEEISSIFEIKEEL